MKRRSFVIVLLGLALALPRAVGGPHPAHAARPSASPHQFLRGLIIGSPAPGRVEPATRVRSLSVSQQSASGTVNSSAQLQLPASAFPGDFSDQQDESVNASEVDHSVFSGDHMSSYTSLGMQGGWLQYYARQMADGTFDDAYLGSYYSSPAEAQAALQDVQRNPDFSHGFICTFGEQCYQDTIFVDFTDGVYAGTVRIVQQSNALAEIISVVPEADLTNLSPQIALNVNRVANSFLIATQPQAPTATAIPTRLPATSTPTTIPTPAPTNTPAPTATPTTIPVDFDIVAARAEKAGSPPDTTLQRAALKRIRIGTRVYLSTYVTVHSAPAGATAAYDVRVTSRGRTVLHKTLQDTLESASNTPSRTHVTFKPSASGSYKVTWQVDVNGVTKQRGNSLVVQK